MQQLYTMVIFVYILSGNCKQMRKYLKEIIGFMDWSIHWILLNIKLAVFHLYSWSDAAYNKVKMALDVAVWWYFNGYAPQLDKNKKLHRMQHDTIPVSRQGFLPHYFKLRKYSGILQFKAIVEINLKKKKTHQNYMKKQIVYTFQLC